MQVDHTFFYENVTIDQAIKKACDEVYNRTTSAQLTSNLQVNGNIATSHLFISETIKINYIFFITDFNNQYLRIEICRK